MNPGLLIKEFDFFAGVPDSRLKALCGYLLDTYGLDPRHHIIAANEGNAAALAAGFHLATGKAPVIYLQNSGLGNIINPMASLLHEKVYGIPCLFIVGWRGEPGVHDEPQHLFQGEVTLRLLEDIGINHFIVSKETTEPEVMAALDNFRELFANGKCAAFVIRKGALSYDQKTTYKNAYAIKREDAIRCIAAAAGNDPIICTTGKASRELFEIREGNGQGHGHDFLTVGSMGHSSSIALGIATQKLDKLVWCVDGDGAALMHMGAMAVIGAAHPNNLVHIVINNEAHESVGGMPTVAGAIDLPAVARACGYASAESASILAKLESRLERVKAESGPHFIEVKCAIGSRADLGRPTTTPLENRSIFMKALNAQ